MTQNNVLPFNNMVVMRFMLDHFIYVEIGNREEILYSILIANDFFLGYDGETHILSTERLSEVGPLLKLFMEPVRSAYYTHEDETLFIEFMNGATITVDPHPDYEAWNITFQSVNSPEQFRLYCSPKEKTSS